MTKLTNLGLGRGVTGTGLRELAALAALRSLNLGGCFLRLQDIGVLPEVEELFLGRAQFSDADLEYLRNLPRLRKLVVEFTSIPDAGLQQMANLRQLQELNLGGTALTDASMPHLSKLTTLNTLVLQRTSVTAGGVAELRKNLPGCKIAWEPSTPSPASAGSPKAAASDKK